MPIIEGQPEPPLPDPTLPGPNDPEPEPAKEL